MPAGQPTKYKKRYCAEVIELMAQGFSKEACAGHFHVTRQTIYNWMDNNPEFLYAVKEGEERALAFWEKLGIEGASGHVSGFNAAAWIFNMKNRAGWKDKQEVTGEGGGALSIIIKKEDEEL